MLFSAQVNKLLQIISTYENKSQSWIDAITANFSSGYSLCLSKYEFNSTLNIGKFYY